MNQARRSAQFVSAIGSLGLAWSAAAAATAVDSAALARCAALNAPDARLQCYDALAARRPAAAAVAPPLPSGAASTVGVANARESVPAPASSPDAFGLKRSEPSRAPEGPASIEATITSVTLSKLGRTQVALDNGQSWAIDETDLHLAAGDRVTIKRAAFGSYLLTTPSRRSYRVKRAQ